MAEHMSWSGEEVREMPAGDAQRQSLHAALDKMGKEKDGEELKALIISEIDGRMRTDLKEEGVDHQAALKSVVDIITAAPTNDRDTFLQTAEDAIIKYLNRFTVKDREDRQRQRWAADEIQNKNNTVVNEIISYHLQTDKEGEKHVGLHVAPAKTLNVGEQRRLIHDAFGKIAELLHHDPAIVDVVGTSWIVAKQPRLMELLGFRMTPFESVDQEGRPVAQCTMEREDFLKRYG